MSQVDNRRDDVLAVWADTAKFTNMRIAVFWKSGHLVSEGELFVEDET